MDKPEVGIIMGSKSDKDILDQAAAVLDEFQVPYEMRIVSAHRTPEEMGEYAKTAAERGLKAIIAGAGGSAHLPGMTASHTVLPVLAVPIKRNENDHEALWSNIKMPPGIPLATLPENGAKNAALMAIEILAISDSELAEKYKDYRQQMHNAVLEDDKNINNT